MAGAIGLPLGRRQSAIGELPASRIPQRPATGGFANVLEAQPSHLSDLGVTKDPGWPPLPRLDPGIEGAVGPRAGGAGPSVRSTRPLRATRARLACSWAAPAATEFNPDPARLADNRISGRDAEGRGDVARALSFKSEPFEILDRLGCPQHLHGPNSCRCAVPAARNGLTMDILVLAERGDVEPPKSTNFGIISNFFSILEKPIRLQWRIWNSPTGTTNTV
jgi:hypothetical protein